MGYAYPGSISTSPDGSLIIPVLGKGPELYQTKFRPPFIP